MKQTPIEMVEFLLKRARTKRASLAIHEDDKGVHVWIGVHLATAPTLAEALAVAITKASE